MWFIVEAGLMGKHSMGIDSHTADALRDLFGNEGGEF